MASGWSHRREVTAREYIETGHGDCVAGFRDGVLGIGIELRVGLLEKRVGQLAWLALGP